MAVVLRILVVAVRPTPVVAAAMVATRLLTPEAVAAVVLHQPHQLHRHNHQHHPGMVQCTS